MTVFIGNNFNNIATTAPLFLAGFVGGGVAQLADAAGDVFFAQGGNDRVIAGNGNDVILGGDGNDFINGRFGFDFMDGGAGIDTMDASFFAGAYVWNMTTGTTNFSGAGEWAFNFENAITGNGNDSIIGTVGANSIRTNGGNDAVNALAGNDRIAGGLGNDRLAGGVGNDAFVFDTLANTLTNTDFLTDFFSPADTIFLENAVYAALPAGALAAAAFRIGAVALDPTDRIIYNPATGDIFYDPNGIGGAAQTRFAHVNPGTPVNFTDFFVT